MHWRRIYDWYGPCPRGFGPAPAEVVSKLPFREDARPHRFRVLRESWRGGPAQVGSPDLKLDARVAHSPRIGAGRPGSGRRAVKVVFRSSFDHDRPYEREYDGIRKFEPVSRSYANQVQILHVGRHDDRGCFHYIMELADDQQRGQQIDPKTYTPKTLRSELRQRGRLPVRECLRIGAALENLHGHGLIHRDIKPGNIIFAHGVPKLADIGLVTDRDVTVSYVSTEGYIPPEGPGSAQVDLFSLGKVLYEMATGRDRMDFPELPTDFEELPDREALLELNAIISKACDRAGSQPLRGSPNGRHAHRTHTADNFRPPITFGCPFGPHPSCNAPYSR